MDKRESIHVIISRIDEAVFDGDALSVIAPGSEGVLTILPGHEPFISRLTAGTIEIESGHETHTVDIEKGLIEVSGDQISVLI